MGSGAKRKRVQISDGTLILLKDGLPELRCELMNIDEEGCRAKVVAGAITLELATVWHPNLAPGQSVNLRVESRMPVLKVHGAATVTHVLEFLNHVEIEFLFVHLAQSQKAAIERARFSSALQDFDLPETPPTVQLPRKVPQEHQSNTGSMPTLMIAASELTVEPKTTAPDTRLHELMRSKKLGEVVVHMGHLSQAQVDEAAAAARAGREPLGRYLTRNKLVTSHVLCHALALQSGLPMVDLTGVQIDDQLSSLFAFDTLLEHQCVPFAEAEAFISIAVSGPLKQKAINELEHIRNKAVRQFLTPEDIVLKMLDRIQEHRRQRQFQRFRANLPVRYQFCNRVGTPTDETIYFVRTLNISEGGLAVEGVPNLLTACPDVRRREMYANLIIVVPEGGIHAICQLRWVRKCERKGTADSNWLIGMQVVEIAREDQQRLSALCEQIALKQE